jgi:type I restriction enzyme R subunit
MGILTEDQTRIKLIDPLLKESGFPLNKSQDREYEVTGMPNNQGIGFVDYVLWGDDGLPLAVVEAKRTIRNPKEGQQQAKLYADCLEKKFRRRPVIYYTNGYEHMFWDDSHYPPRSVQGFHTKDELELLMQRRSSLLTLSNATINNDIVERPYQHLAIRSITESLEKYNQRRSLIVMATGSGKTRTIIALVDLLIKCNWVKRVLFLADRRALVKQASREFGKHLPNISVVNLLQNNESEGRIYVSTYQTILNQINKLDNQKRRFGIGFFDLVIVDEAHRSIYSKYKGIFNYFDSYLVGLTATPKDEIDRNTYSLFQQETGVPTFAFDLEAAIKGRYLVPPKSVSVPLKIIREGLKYDQLSEDEKQQWDELEWGEEGPPIEVDSADINRRLFNQDTVDQVLKHLMTKGEKVASGDRIGKTIIFAKNNLHADYIEERFNINYPQYKGELARVITYQTEYAQNLIDKFSIKEESPHIAISVDMLDTGIDIPEIVNLIFFKIVRSKTKFWQMLGRGTRLCKDLYHPGEDKKFFYIFDYCGNLEYFNQNPESVDGSSNDSLDARLFKKRVEILKAYENNKSGYSKEEIEVQQNTIKYLHGLISNMTLENVIVRSKRRFVEKYSDIKNWKQFTELQYDEISNELSSLPSQQIDTDEEAKYFDITILKLQLCILNKNNTGFDKLQTYIKTICSALEVQDSIPSIRAQMSLIQEISTDEWWEDVTIGMLEHVRQKLRSLVKLIEKSKRNIVYTNFKDTLDEETTFEFPINIGSLDFEKFKIKAKEYLHKHENKIAVNKLRRNIPVTKVDIEELEIILLSLADNDSGLVKRAKENTNGLGLFVRSLIGLERSAATEAMSEFLKDSTANTDQIKFLGLIVEELTKDGAMEDSRLYQAPFTDVTPTGPESIFDSDKVEKLFIKIKNIRLSAVA